MTEAPAAVAALPAALTRYAARLRDAAGLHEATIVSPTGLWLLLAAIAPAGEDPARRAELAEQLGLPVEEASEAVAALLADPHPAVGAALAGWIRPDLRLRAPVPGPVPVDPLPDKAALDAWAARHTRGLIEQFPLQVDPSTLLVLASALVTEPRWRAPLREEDGWLLLADTGVQAVVETEAAGPVAVAAPSTADGVDVLSVIAAPDVAPAQVWAAVDEVVARRLSGELDGAGAAPDGDGHAWTVTRQIEEFVQFRAPEDGAARWRSRLPAWRADQQHTLTTAPGVAAAAAGVIGLLPTEATADGVAVECVQAATASYDRDGFRAAAITAMGVRATGAPRFVHREVRRVEVTFDRPHAVVAVARGGAWDGVPLFEAWVRPRPAARETRPRSAR